MPRVTNSENLDDLSRRVTSLEAQATSEAIADQNWSSKVDQELLRLRSVESQHIRQIAFLEQRCTALEAGHGRQWQLWLALLAAAASLVIALARR